MASVTFRSSAGTSTPGRQGQRGEARPKGRSCERSRDARGQSERSTVAEPDRRNRRNGHERDAAGTHDGWRATTADVRTARPGRPPRTTLPARLRATSQRSGRSVRPQLRLRPGDRGDGFPALPDEFMDPLPVPVGESPARGSQPSTSNRWLFSVGIDAGVDPPATIRQAPTSLPPPIAPPRRSAHRRHCAFRASPQPTSIAPPTHER